MMNVLIEYANAVGNQWAAWVTTALLNSAALLALIGLLWLAIRNRVAPHVGYCLFLLVPLKLLVPVSVTVPVPIAQWTPSGLVSAWFDGARVPESIESHPPVERRTAAVLTDKSAPSEPRLKSPEPFQSIVADSHQLNLATEARSQWEMASTTGAMANSATEVQRPSVAAVFMIVWVVGVLLLLGGLARSQLRFRARLRHNSPLNESQLAVDLRELCRHAGITQTIHIVENDCIAAPAVWGIARPTIILPHGFTPSLTAQQRRWVLLHELAHVRRRDLVVVAFQRFATILHFFNPAVWIANRIINRLREYACDDLAVSQSDCSVVESGEAFLQILRQANRSSRGLHGALGVFGLDSRASCFLRVRRLLEIERPVHTRTGPWAICGLLLLAVVALPHLRAGSDGAQSDPPTAAGESAKADKPQPKAGTDAALARDKGEFELRVVGPDGKPIPEATVEIRTGPIPTADQIRQGKFVRKGPYGAFVTTDAEGRLVVRLSKMPDNFNVDVTTSGYGPYWARWSSDEHDQPIPSRFTVELEAGWSVGGIIVDSEGKPVEGVRIGPSIEFKKRAGDTRQLGVGTNLKTDAQGKWRFDSVPASMSEVFVEISHSGFMPNRRPLTRSEFGIERGQEPVAKVVLDRGLTVTGKITDDTGSPIVGALVRTKFLNDIREAKTGDDGAYRLGGCESRTTKIVVSAKGRATDMQEVRVDSEMDPVDFQMKPGGRIRIRVLDEQDAPIPKARILFQRWRSAHFEYFEFGHVGEYTDDNGVWEWNEAPLDEFKADICRPDGMELAKQSLIARDEEYVFHPPAALVVSGNVFDAETKRPIPKFHVVPGIRGSETQMNWVNDLRLAATDGKYRIRQTHDYFAHLIRIEANGYQAVVSRDIKSNEGNVLIDFELKRGTDVAAIVLTTDGKPAAKARVALGVAGSQIIVKNGEIDEGSTYCERQDTGESGKFRFPPQDTEFQLVIIHPAGFAHVKTTPEAMPETIELQAWARVEGTFRVGKKTVPSAPITINTEGLHSYGDGVPRIFTHYDVTTGKDGRFAFERVVPGRADIRRRIMLTVNDGATMVTSSCIMIANFTPGETTRIDLGGNGRPVTGKLQPSDGFDGKVLWNFAIVNVNPFLPKPPMPDKPPLPADVAKDPAKKAAWMLKWQQTPAGKGWTAWKTVSEEIQRLRATIPSFTASVDSNGAFRIDDMPSGTYSLSVRFDREAAGQLQNYRFSVPVMDGNRSDQPLDLGTLTLEK